MCPSNKTDRSALQGVDFERLVDSIPQIVWTAASDGTPEYLSRRGTEYTGLRHGERYGWDLAELIHPDDIGGGLKAWRGAVAENVPYEISLRLRSDDGRYRRHMFSALPVRDYAGNVVQWAGTATDIEEQSGLEERLHQAQRRVAEVLSLLETLQSAAPIGLGFCDRDFRMLRVNDALAATNGIPAEQQIGRTVPEMIPEIWPQLEPVYQGVIDSGEPVINAEASGVLPGSEHEQTWLTSFYPVYVEEDVIGLGIVVVNITERKTMERKLEDLADHDPLTGLVNRRRLHVDLERVIKTGARYGHTGAVLVLDIDNFKLTNDSYGHLSGDNQLNSVARVLVDRLRETDIAARTGGDEFVAVLPETTADHAMGVARDLRSQLSERRSGLPIQVSIGIAPFNGAEAVTTDDLLAAADTAMYRAKGDGGGRVALYDGPAGEVRSRVRHIQAALTDDRFVLYGQPIVDLSSGEIDHHELLIRMRGEDGQIILPQEFVPIAEEFSLMREIDRWVVRQALDLARHQSVSANLSGLSVGDPQILTDVREAIGEGLDPRNLRFELTETSVMADFDRAMQFICALVELGCEIALDDFGTGFGTFLYLKNLPANYLKIDMEFVRGINGDPVDRLIVESIITVAHAVGKKTIAEGVETAEVLETLRELGVDYAQGWYFGRPSPVLEGQRDAQSRSNSPNSTSCDSIPAQTLSQRSSTAGSAIR